MPLKNAKVEYATSLGATAAQVRPGASGDNIIGTERTNENKLANLLHLGCVSRVGSSVCTSLVCRICCRCPLLLGKPQTSAFAGQYILTTIGCGASCILSSIIDARSGQVTWLPFTICCWDPGKPLDFRLDSSLLVVHGMRDEQEPNGTFYYAFEEGKFRLVAQPQK